MPPDSELPPSRFFSSLCRVLVIRPPPSALLNTPCHSFRLCFLASWPESPRRTPRDTLFANVDMEEKVDMRE